MNTFNSNGWLEVYSDILQESIYFIRDDSVKTPKNLVRYKLMEVLAFKGLDARAKKILHEGKKLMKGEVVK